MYNDLISPEEKKLQNTFIVHVFHLNSSDQARF